MQFSIALRGAKSIVCRLDLYSPIERKIMEEVAPFFANTHSFSSETGKITTHIYKEARNVIKKHVHANDNDILITTGSGMTGALACLQRIMGLRKYQYWSPEEKPLLLILWQEGSPGLSDDLAPLVHRVFQEHTDVLFRTYSMLFTEGQLREGNLFFIEACKPENLKYSIPGQHLPALTEGMDMQKALEIAKDRFQKEYAKATDFKEGALFYIKKSNYAQAAFMLHQSIELAYRLIELLAIGKEKVCHSIANHQKYIRHLSRNWAHCSTRKKKQPFYSYWTMPIKGCVMVRIIILHRSKLIKYRQNLRSN